MIVSLFYVSFVSFLEKGGKALLLGSVFPVFTLMIRKYKNYVYITSVYAFFFIASMNLSVYISFIPLLKRLCDFCIVLKDIK